MIQVGYGAQRFPESDVTRVEEMSSTSCSCSHSQAGFGPENDLSLISDCSSKQNPWHAPGLFNASRGKTNKSEVIHRSLQH